MSAVAVRELACWGFDAYPYRAAGVWELAPLAVAGGFVQGPVLQAVPEDMAEALRVQTLRDDLLYEMRGLDWTTAMVDLRELIAFQRRLSFDPVAPVVMCPEVGDWRGLLRLCFGVEKTVAYTIQPRPAEPTSQTRDVRPSDLGAPQEKQILRFAKDDKIPRSFASFEPGRTYDHPHAMEPDEWGTQASVAGDGSRVRDFVLESHDPNLQVCLDESQSLRVYAGSPFLEVAEFRGRWFLRDGYHRAYALLQRGISVVPAVLVRARTLAELGATQPRFFAEDVLFGERPPRVVDFLKDNLCVTYERPPLLRRLRVRVEEGFAVADEPTATETGERA